MNDSEALWYVYLIECRGGSIYTGIAIDVEARFRAHSEGRGARYTRANPPLRILARFAYPDRSAASRAEAAIKRLATQRKWQLVRDEVAPP
jgi:putative endonuclease